MTCRSLIVIAVVTLAVASSAIASAQDLSASAEQGWQLAGAFPQSEPGPLERRARPITPENPIPRRTHLVRPPYPSEAATIGVRATVSLRVTVDHLGTVGEVRSVGAPVLGAIPPGTLPDDRAFTAGLLALIRSAKDAVGQWVYAPPVDAPIAFDVAIGFTPDGGGEVTSQSAGRNPRTSDVAPVQPIDRNFGGGAAPPRKVKHVAPVYPAAAREAKISGTVIIEARVEADGRILEARVLRSVPELDDAALEAVKQWEFTPTLIDGTPTAVTMMLTIQFSLQ